MKIHGMLRIRNEGRWIADVLESIEPLCSTIHVLDDHSVDDTVAICKSFPSVRLYESQFEGLDEARDKTWLLHRIWEDKRTEVGDWVLLIDGDEMLAKGDAAIIQHVTELGAADAYHLNILYLWDSLTQVRVDGVYGRFKRPSLFKLIDRKHTFATTPYGGNLHCSSIPSQLLNSCIPCAARLLHLGYMHKSDRIRKYEWYNSVDPNNPLEDGYRHVVQGDIPEIPAGIQLRHAGPLTLAPLVL